MAFRSILDEGKQTINLNDPRYEKSDRLSKNEGKDIRPSFTLYDGQDEKQVSVDEIRRVYQLSDKKLSLNELLGKIVDFIEAFGSQNAPIVEYHNDPIYAWQYADTLAAIAKERLDISEPLLAFDNGFRYTVINNPDIQSQFPNKYTLKTDFSDKKVSQVLAQDLEQLFLTQILPSLHKKAIAFSKIQSDKKDNTVITGLSAWAQNTLGCKADLKSEILQDEETQIYYKKNSLLLYLKNGYMLSIVGYVGTTNDARFEAASFNPNNADKNLLQTAEGEQMDIKNFVDTSAKKENIPVIAYLLERQERDNRYLLQNVEYLQQIKPMIEADVLKMPAASSVVDSAYITNSLAEQQRQQQLGSLKSVETLRKDYQEWKVNQKNQMKQEVQPDEDSTTQSPEPNLMEVKTEENSEISVATDTVPNNGLTSNTALMNEIHEISTAFDTNDSMMTDYIPQNNTESNTGMTSSANVSDDSDIDELFDTAAETPAFQEKQSNFDSLEDIFGEKSEEPDPESQPTTGQERIVEMPQMPQIPQMTTPKSPKKDDKKEPEMEYQAVLLPGFDFENESPKSESVDSTKDTSLLTTTNDSVKETDNIDSEEDLDLDSIFE